MDLAQGTPLRTHKLLAYPMIHGASLLALLASFFTYAIFSFSVINFVFLLFLLFSFSFLASSSCVCFLLCPVYSLQTS